MTSKIFLTGIATVLATAMGANATTIRPFAGATMGLQGVYYNSGLDASELDSPKDFITFGLEAGARFGEYNKIYNYGFSVNYDNSSREKIKDKFSDVTRAKINTNVFSATFDNYMRLSGDKMKRIDLVLGAGLGMIEYNADWTGASDDTRWSSLVELKAGLDFELTHNITLSAQTRLFVPMRDAYGIKASYIAGGAVKYVF
ncbi:MAG: hypothetical protein IJV03_01725 [Alphaproteobacteria bacterium]|nr:hypothetical protein [Alphaproteobacteria bacterium]